MVLALNTKDITFMMYVAVLAELTIMSIYSSCQVPVTLLTRKENGIFAEYSNVSNIFFLDSVVSY